jgi:hypothetical protein
MSATFKISNARRIGKGTLVGSFDLETPSFKFYGAMLFEKGGRRWIGFQSKEWINKDGDKKYFPVVEFASTEARDRFQAQALPLAEAEFGL